MCVCVGGHLGKKETVIQGDEGYSRGTHSAPRDQRRTDREPIQNREWADKWFPLGGKTSAESLRTHEREKGVCVF